MAAFYFKVFGNKELHQHYIPATTPKSQADLGKVPKGNVVREEVQASEGRGQRGLLPASVFRMRRNSLAPGPIGKSRLGTSRRSRLNYAPAVGRHRPAHSPHCVAWQVLPSIKLPIHVRLSAPESDSDSASAYVGLLQRLRKSADDNPYRSSRCARGSRRGTTGPFSGFNGLHLLRDP